MPDRKPLNQVRKCAVDLDRLNREERILVNSIGILGGQVDAMGSYAAHLQASADPEERILPSERLRDLNMLVQTMVKVVELQNKITLWKREQLAKMSTDQLKHYLIERGIEDVDIKG